MTTMENENGKQILGAKDLLADGIEYGSHTVERSQQSLIRRIFSVVGHVTGRRAEMAPYEELTRLILSLNHGNVRLISRLVSRVLSATHHVAGPALLNSKRIREPIAMRSDIIGSPSWIWDGFLGLVNGMVGDHLYATENSLATQMSLRYGERRLELSAEMLARTFGTKPPPFCIFIHGLGTTEWSWAWDAEAQQGSPDTTYGSLLENELQFAPLYLRYNTGRHISDNGQELANLLQRLHDTSPAGINDLVLIGHSMGGLVAHSAAHYGHRAGHEWTQNLRQVISIAAPHDGAPLEKIGNIATYLLGAIDTPGTRIPAEMIDARSAGIKDLRHGYIVEEDWYGNDPDLPLNDTRTHAQWVAGVHYHRIVSTLTNDPAHPIGRVVGDALVRPKSAAAAHPKHGAKNSMGDVVEMGGISHIGLANHPRVYEQLRAWLS